jgi:prenyltransferase beta subunit
MKRYYFVLLAALIGLAPTWGQAAEQKTRTVDALQSLQAKDGGFFADPSARGRHKPSIRATVAALRALKYFGGKSQHQAACINFVRQCYDASSGGFADHPGGKPDVGTTAVGVMAVVELEMPVKDYRDGVVGYLGKHVKTFEDIRIAAAGFEAIHERPAQADSWLEQIAKLRNADGTYGKRDGVARDTGGAVAAILRLGGKVEQRENVVRALKMGQREDGGFGKERAPGSDLETTYRVMRAFAMLKEKPDIEHCRAFIGRCRNADGLSGIAPGQPSGVGSTYYAAIILHWLAEMKP